ncbi:MAG: hypothetical protein ABTQ34_05860 [Bdellovibrionales bacterium]
MRLNCGLILLTVLLWNALTIAPGYAQGAAPSLYGIKEIIVQAAQINNAQAAEACGITRADITEALLSVLRSANVPAMDVNEAPPSIVEIPRINLRPEVALTNNGQGLDCTSWLSLNAESKNNLIIPPITIPKNVQIIYWREGAIVTSTQSAHGQIINDVIRKMAGNFAKQYIASQPQKIK